MHFAVLKFWEKKADIIYGWEKLVTRKLPHTLGKKSHNFKGFLLR